MKILHAITSLQTGGAEKLMVDLLPRLRDKGCDVELAIFDGRVTPFYESLSNSGIKIHRFMPNGGNVYHPINIWKLILLARKNGYDIVHTHNTSPQLFAAISSLICKPKFVTTEHGGSNRRRKWNWYRGIDKWMYGRYDRIICIADKTREALEDWLQKDTHICKKIKTIYNGVDITKYINPIKQIKEAASITIVMVAGFRWEKDQDTIIRVLARLPKKYKLKLIGDGARRQELESLAEREGVKDRVEFAGVRSDIPEQLKNADIVIMSSHFEGLSLSSVEGMASGRPFIASDVDGLREVVKGAGILFPHEDDQKLAEEILKLTNDSDYYQSVAEKCQNRARAFDISEMVDEYYKLYQEIQK